MQPPSPAVTPRSEASRLRRVRLRMCVLAPVVAAALMLLPVASRADSVCAYSPPGDTLDATAPSASFPTGPSGASLPGRRDMFKASRDLFTVDVAPRFSACSPSR